MGARRNEVYNKEYIENVLTLNSANMNTILTNYYRPLLSATTWKSKVKKVTNSSFAEFLTTVYDCIEELRNLHDTVGGGTYTNYEKDFKFGTIDLMEMMDNGLSLIHSKESSDEEKENGAQMICYAAYCGLPSAMLLLGIHSICDSSSKKDKEFGSILLNRMTFLPRWDGYTPECDEAKEVLELYYSKLPAPWMNVENYEIEKYSKAYYVAGRELDFADCIGKLIIEGCTDAIGCIRICCGWYQKPIEVIYRNDKIDVYAIPTLPVWYVWKSICDTVGEETMNDLAGVTLCELDNNDDVLPPVVLRNEPESRGLTHVIAEDFYICYHDNLPIVFETAEQSTLSYEEDENHVWHVYIPKSWNVDEVKVQRQLTRYINNIMPKMAEAKMQIWYDDLTSTLELAQGKCHVNLVGNTEWYVNDEGGADFDLPFDILKMPTSVIDSVLLWPFMEDGASAEKYVRIYSDLQTDGAITTSADYKLLEAKMKRSTIDDIYGEKLFKGRIRIIK